MEEERKKLSAAVVLGRRGGLVKSEAKAAAVRLNGLLGGAAAWKTPRDQFKPRKKKIIKPKKRKFKVTVPVPTPPMLTAIPIMRPRPTQKTVREHAPR